MKLYCEVHNNIVVNGPTLVPIALNALSDFELLDLGWYIADCIRPDTFSDQYEVMLPIQYVVQPHKVICTFTKRSKTQAELDAQNAEKQQQVEADKGNRLTFADTFMQSPEYAALLPELQLAWVGYVQTVTDTVTVGLGNAIWDVNFPPQPPTTNPEPVPVVLADG